MHLGHFPRVLDQSVFLYRQHLYCLQKILMILQKQQQEMIVASLNLKFYACLKLKSFSYFIVILTTTFVLYKKNINYNTKSTARNDSFFIKFEILCLLKIKIISLLHFYLVMEFFKN